MRPPEVVRFGSFTLVPRRRQLLFRGEPVPLGARAFDLLTALVGREGALAAKDQLMAEIWGGAVVEENNLAAQVSALRKVLAADAGLRQCLQAVPGRGYRFVADMEVGTESMEGAVQSRDREALSLVALPFASPARDAGQGEFALGLSHTLATDLSRIAGLLVIASSTAATFAGAGVDLREVSRELGVRYVLTGSVQRNGHRLRINAQLADGRSGLQLWSELFDGEGADPFALQDRITGRIANAIGREVFVAAARDRPHRIHPTSLDLVMRGIAADNRPQSLNSLREQEQLFARAVEIDPTHADALARLARAILLQATQLHAPALDQATVARGVSAAERAVALDPGNARTHVAMGLVHVLRRDFARSALANEAAIALDRNFALAHNNLGNSLVHLGNGVEALAAVHQALWLDPRGPQLGACETTQGFAHLLLGDGAAGFACFSRARVANPALPRAHVGAAVSLALAGDVEAARDAAADLLALAPGYRLSRSIDAGLPVSPAGYRRFYENVLRPAALQAGLPL